MRTSRDRTKSGQYLRKACRAPGIEFFFPRACVARAARGKSLDKLGSLERTSYRAKESESCGVRTFGSTDSGKLVQLVSHSLVAPFAISLLVIRERQLAYTRACASFNVRPTTAIPFSPSSWLCEVIRLGRSRLAINAKSRGKTRRLDCRAAAARSGASSRQASQGENEERGVVYQCAIASERFSSRGLERGINRVERPNRERKHDAPAGRDDHDARRKRQAARGTGLRAEGSARALRFNKHRFITFYCRSSDGTNQTALIPTT